MAPHLKYITDLYEQKAKINKLKEDIERFDRNESHVEALSAAFKEARLELEALVAKHSAEYVPAIEKAQQLENELQMARADPDGYDKIVAAQLAGYDSEAVKEKIEALTIEAANARNELTLVEPEEIVDVERESFEVVDGDAIKSSFNPAKGKQDRRRSHFSWTPSSVLDQLKDLEALHEEKRSRMRRLSCKSCALTSGLCAIQKKIEHAKYLMRRPPSALYSDLSCELAHFKIRAYSKVLENLKANEINSEVGYLHPRFSFKSSANSEAFETKQYAAFSLTPQIFYDSPSSSIVQNV